MAITFVNAASANSGTGTVGSLAPAKPTGLASGDLLVAVVAVAGGTGATITPVDAWINLQFATSTTNTRWAFYYLIAGGSEPSTYVFNFDTTRRGAASVAAYHSASFETFIGLSTSTAVTPNTITTSAANDFVIYLIGGNNTAGQNTWTPAASTNERADTTNTATTTPWFSTTIADEAQAVAGTSASRSFTPSRTQALARSATWSFAIAKTQSTGAAVSGTGSVSATGAHTAFGAAGVSGSGSVSAVGVRTRLTGAAAAGTGTVSATGTVSRFGAATATGTGVIAATGVRTCFGAAALTATGSVSASGGPVIYGAADLQGTGTISATGAIQITGAAALEGTGTISATAAAATIHTGAALYGTGTISATGHLEIWIQTTDFAWVQTADDLWPESDGDDWAEDSEDSWTATIGANW